MRNMNHSLKVCRGVASIAALCFWVLSACSPIIDSRGHVETNTSPETLKAGTSSKDDVLKAMGSPSSTSNFGDETWYYISARKERKAFFKPEVKDQHVTRIVFNNEGVIAKIDNYSQADSQKITTVEEITPTEGHKLTVAEQIIGNLGRFNKDANKKGAAAPTPSRPY